MIYRDSIFGKQKIKKAVVLEIIKTPAFQRLKAVDQAGYFHPYWPGYASSRYDHSIGVYLLLKKFQAPLIEQVAGLIHDLSHAAFSHCVDYVLEEGSQKHHDHQDNIFKAFVLKTKVPKILKKYDYNVDYILDETNFPLKERNLPDLCADRIDYFLRTALIVRVMDKKLVNNLINSLFIENNYWVFQSYHWAKKYALKFKEMNDDFYSGMPSACMFATVGDLLRYGLKKKYINKKDLYTTDKIVLKKIKKYLKKDKKLNILWQRMNNKIKVKNNKKNFDLHVFVKSRSVDPLFKKGNKTLRLSDQYKKWKKVLKKDLNPKEYCLKFEK